MAGADTSLTHDDCPDDLTDEGFEQGDFSSGRPLGDDASLTPLLRIQKYAQSGDIFDRHWVPKVVQDIFQTAPADVLTKELPDIMKVLTNTANDGIVKIELLENIPQIAAQAMASSVRVQALKDVIGDYLIPLVMRNLGCTDTGADKKAQLALIQLIEQGYVSPFQAEIKICPSILALTKMETYSVGLTLITKHRGLMNSDAHQLDVKCFKFHITASFDERQRFANATKLFGKLMSKLAPLLGRDIAERIFLKRFKELCSSSLFNIRKLATSYFGYYCLVAGKSAFEDTLLPSYLQLCQDEIWGVRKACAEVIMFLSSVCSPTLRKSELAPAFSHLLEDECKWVRVSAYQSLGAFITTFADPPLTTISTNIYGELVLMNLDGYQFHPGGVDGFANFTTTSMKEEITLDDIINSAEMMLKNDKVTDLDDAVLECDVKDTGTPLTHEDDLLLYNEYKYWHITPTDVVIDDPDLLGPVKEDDISVEDVVTNHLEELYATINLNDSLNSTTPLGDINNSDNLDLISDNLTVTYCSIPIQEEDDEEEIKLPTQTIVPDYLIDCFVCMAHSENYLKDNDMSFHCAYSLPAVVLTLGKDNWPLLKGTLQTLAEHMSYKVRRIVASGLHEIATILGPELTNDDLAPLLEGFLQDLDEVRIGILNNLFKFLELLSVEKREKFLPKLEEFLRVENVCNWRFQEKFAEQLHECIQLFEPQDVAQYIGRYAQCLMGSNVAAVRDAAMDLVSGISKHIANDRALVTNYLTVIAERFAHSRKWKPRQTFAMLCIRMLKHDSIEEQDFANVLMPHLLDLSWDPVANIRLVVARCVVEQIAIKHYFQNPMNDQINRLANVIRRLQTDKDRDVRMATHVTSSAVSFILS